MVNGYHSGSFVEKGSFEDSPLGRFVYHDPEEQNLHMFSDDKPKNVILFGETGAGKSSVINLMANRDVAHTSPDLEGCTLHAEPYLFTLPSLGIPLRIFDTVGLEEPKMGVNTFLGAIEKAHRLITSLYDAGGIDLLVFCVKGGRLTEAMQRDYRLFYEILCDKRVPVAVVVTCLENEKGTMDDWWKRNEVTFKKYGISAVAHACITALPAYLTFYAEKQAQSQSALRDLFNVALSNPARPSFLQDIRNWLAAFLQRFRSFLPNGTFLWKRVIARKLRTRCSFSPDLAREVAGRIAGY